MSIARQGDVIIARYREIMPSTDDFLLMEFQCCTKRLDDNKIIPILCGDRKIGINFRIEADREMNPTLFMTDLKWKTFHGDDNMLVMVKNTGKPYQTITILITRKWYDC